jgi:hypothetical protein
LAEDLQGGAQVEGLVDGGGGVDLDAVVGEGFFGGGKEGGFGGGAREVEEGEDGEEEGGGAFD